MDNASLEERVSRLEASNRRLRASLYGFIVLAAVVTASAWQTASSEVRTRKLVIVDGAGSTVATVGESGSQRGLIVYGKDGSQKIAATATDAVSKLTLECNLNGARRKTEVQAATGLAGLVAGWPDGTPSAQLGLDKTKRLHFTMWDGKKMRALIQP